MEGKAVLVLNNPYTVLSRLGGGSEGDVYRVRCQRTGEVLALKKGDRDALAREARALATLGAHDHLVTMRAFDSAAVFPSGKRQASLLLEYCPGGDLFDVVAHTGPLAESTARALMQQLLLGADHMHAVGVCHRDLKCENLLLDANDSLRIADFGFAVHNPDDRLLRTALGSELYMAPEVRRGVTYDGFAADCWAIGVVLFVLLTKAYPFPREHAHWWWTAARTGNFSAFWAAHARTIPALSRDAVDLITRLFSFDPAPRLTVDEVAAHPWMQQPVPSRADLADELRRRRCAAAAARSAAYGATASTAAVTPDGTPTLLPSPFTVVSSLRPAGAGPAASTSAAVPPPPPPPQPPQHRGAGVPAAPVAVVAGGGGVGGVGAAPHVFPGAGVPAAAPSAPRGVQHLPPLFPATPLEVSMSDCDCDYDPECSDDEDRDAAANAAVAAARAREAVLVEVARAHLREGQGQPYTSSFGEPAPAA